MSIDPAELKRRHHAMWAAGDFPSVASYMVSSAGRLVERAGIEPGMGVLDVATGSGNVAIPAALAGAEVVGLDLTPEMFPAGERRAAEAGVSVRFVEGDAEDLPFEDASFDAVLSSFGVMFAPRHRVAAAELIRVCRPDGVIGLTTWTPEGVGGGLFGTVARYMPPLPPFASPPLLWGEEDYVSGLLAPGGFACAFERDAVTLPFTGEQWVAIMERSFGPFLVAQRTLEPDRWQQLRADLVEVFASGNEVRDGVTVFDQEYLLTVARRA